MSFSSLLESEGLVKLESEETPKQRLFSTLFPVVFSRSRTCSLFPFLSQSIARSAVFLSHCVDRPIDRPSRSLHFRRRQTPIRTPRFFTDHFFSPSGLWLPIGCLPHFLYFSWRQRSEIPVLCSAPKISARSVLTVSQWLQVRSKQSRSSMSSSSRNEKKPLVVTNL